MQNVYVFLTTDFEEIEAITSIDVLRRGGVKVTTVSLTGSKIVKGLHEVEIRADILFSEVKLDNVQLLLLPGGTTEINNHQGLRDLIKKFVESAGKVAAICAAPIVLGTLGLLKNKQATCYPSLESYLEGATLSDAGVVVDGNLITGKGPALSMEFALTVLEQLAGSEKRHAVAAELLFNK